MDLILAWRSASNAGAPAGEPSANGSSARWAAPRQRRSTGGSDPRERYVGAAHLAAVYLRDRRLGVPGTPAEVGR